MSDIAVIGSDSFITGFGLIGIRKRIAASPAQAHDTIQKNLQENDAGVLVIDEELIKGMHPDDRRRIEDSVKPVVVVLSKEGSSQNLRQSIIRAIGVDLWKEE